MCSADVGDCPGLGGMPCRLPGPMRAAAICVHSVPVLAGGMCWAGMFPALAITSRFVATTALRLSVWQFVGPPRRH